MGTSAKKYGTKKQYLIEDLFQRRPDYDLTKVETRSLLHNKWRVLTY